MSAPSDQGENAPPPFGVFFGIEKPGMPTSGTVPGNGGRHAAEPAKTTADEKTVSRNTGDDSGPQPPPAPLTFIGLIDRILSSKERSSNLVRILLASAVLVAVISLAISLVTSRISPVLIIGLTSAGTVIVAVATTMMSAKKRRATSADAGASDLD